MKKWFRAVALNFNNAICASRYLTGITDTDEFNRRVDRLREKGIL